MNENTENIDKTNPPAEQWETLTTHDVAKLFNEFISGYDYWRSLNGLSSSTDNIHEALTAMSDKHGRLCRQIKHFERNDPKPDWPEGMTESIVGYLIYALMVLKKYDVDILKGMKNELQNAVDQHSGRKVFKFDEVVEEALNDDLTDSPIIKLVSLMIADAVRSGANQIRLNKDSQGFRTEYRKDGELIKYESIPENLQSAVIMRIFIMGGMNSVDVDKNAFNKGKIEVSLSNEPYEIEVKSYPSSEENRPTINMIIKKKGE